MNRTGLIGLSLTLLMLLLVLASAFVFLFQGRQRLLEQRNTAVTSLSQAEQELGVTYNSLDDSTRALATAEATNLLLEGQLVESQQELDELTLSMATREAEFNIIAQERDTFLSQVPTIEIVSPQPTDSVFIGSPVEYDFFVADGVGVTAVILSIDAQQVATFSLLGQQTARIQGNWTPERLGPVVMGIQASNARTSVLVTQTLTVTSSSSQIVPLNDAPFVVERSEVETAVSQIRGLAPVEIGNIPTTFQDEPANPPAAPVFMTESVTNTLNVGRMFDIDNPSGQAQARGNAIEYNPIINQFTFSTNAEAFTPLNAYNYANAYGELLLDQNFNWPRVDLPSHDAWLAHYALFVGESNLLQAELLDSGFFSAEDTALISEQPEVEQGDWHALLTTAGEAFAASFVNGEDYGRLNDVWQALPVSTEQLLHPEKYVAGETPIVVTTPDLSATLDASWQPVHQATLGEAALRLYLSRFLNEAQVETSASGWGGDQYTVYQNSESGALLLMLNIVWDSLEDSNEFAALYPNYPMRLFDTEGELQSIGECWQGDDVICLIQNESETTIIRAPDLETAVLVGEAQP